VTPAELAAAVRTGIERDRVAHGLPERIEDPVTVARVAAIFAKATPPGRPAGSADPQPRRRRPR
jgi:hypothetical protein